MESHLIARLAVANSPRFVALRVVIDASRRNIPPTALACVSFDGETNPWQLSRLLLGRPSDTLDVIKLSADWWPTRKALLYCSEVLGASVRVIELYEARRLRTPWRTAMNSSADVLLTGASGLVGSAVLRALLRDASM